MGPRVYNEEFPFAPSSDPMGVMPSNPATISDFETVLEGMLATANASGEAFLDVTSKTLSKAVSGPDGGAKGLAVCCRLMRRMMIPGDHELSSSFGRNGSTLLIRFRLPR